MKIEIIKKGLLKQKYHFRIKSANGRIICISEKYNNLSDVLNAIDLIKFEVSNAPIINK